ncbi:Syntaxin-binding protein 1 [Rhynchospora pubera]|uniref:Syntaxin-binding protein 1 n=1 Tax=Rhynchospora pubera TaxID=906938 RepID=A0AAV8GIY3_9POAL|nr:Syntaxin-binding protein 1 [Rhynchospora pubera]KAJ4804219.1 Syntaxin-binding protein 1 [Rhynchospora pubera]
MPTWGQRIYQDKSPILNQLELEKNWKLEEEEEERGKMSGSSLDFAFGSNEEYKPFRQFSRDRILNDMLKSPQSKTPWKVLIMDKFTVKIMSYLCKMSDITDCGVSLVEEIFKRREPMTSMDAIYFIQPLKENVLLVLSDMSGRCPLYKKAFIYFSSPVPKELVTYIKNDSSVIPRIGALSEMNLEYFAADTQAFLTDHDMALEDLFGEDAEKSRFFNSCINGMATRIATVLASLKEFPNVRYRAAKASGGEVTPHDLVPTKLAAAVWEIVSKFKSSIPDYPQRETCDLLILDRTVDQIAPFIHEWTYDAMCHDLLDMDGNKYVHETQNKDGSTEKKEVILEEHDPVWLELRHTHIGDAIVRVTDKFDNFVAKNKAAQIQSMGKDGNEISTKDLQKVVQSLPQYTEQKDRLALHVDIAGKIFDIVDKTGLKELGKLEQDLVYGDAGAKEVINFLRVKQDLNPENKLRLLMIYAIAYPEKFEGDKGEKLMQLAKISREDMKTVNNLRYLAGLTAKKAPAGAFSLKFDNSKKKNAAARKERTEGEELNYQLWRFFPLVEELVVQLNAGELSQQDYPCMNEPSPSPSPNVNSAPSGSVRTTQAEPAGSHRSTQSQPVVSRRSRRTPTWANKANSDDGSSSDSVLRHASSEFSYKRMGKRIIVFMIGGATRSELRVVHKLTSKFQREVILGSTSLDDPPMFITKFKMLKTPEVPVDKHRK